MWEGICTRCEETFIPHSPTPEDMIHGETQQGTPCGGIGVMLGKSGNPITHPESAALVELREIEAHGVTYPNCAGARCSFHHPVSPQP